MEPTKMYNSENSKYIALAQLHRTLKKDTVPEKGPVLDILMKRGLDVHYAIPPDAMVAQHKPELVGWTALHFAVEARDEETMTYVIQYDAKVTVLNKYSFSPIRLALEYPWKEHRCLKTKGLTEHGVVEWLLKIQHAQNDPSNPSCKLGITHLHIACMVNDAKLVKYLLHSGASVEAAVEPDSPHLPGYRPIHVAVRYCAFDSLKQLLQVSGIDFWAREARGLSPLHLIVECNLELAEILKQIEGSSPLIKYSLANECMANLLLAHGPIQDEYGLEQLHVAASMVNTSMLEALLETNPDVNVNAAISENSSLWPGCTPLHFAARCSLNAVKVLLKKGANLFSPDVSGITPFDLCLYRYEPNTYYEIMSCDQTLKSITFNSSPNVTLCDAVKALQSIKSLQAFLKHKMTDVNDCVSLDSPLWPGYTLQHLAVTMVPLQNSEKSLNKLTAKFGILAQQLQNWGSWNERMGVLNYLQVFGVNPIAQDLGNSTAVHLAFRQGKPQAARRLLEQIRHKLKTCDNLTDEGGLSLMHIISSVIGNAEIADSFLLNNVDVNARTTSELRIKWYEPESSVEFYLNAGSTPLHVAVASKSWLVDNLIKKGADPRAIDDDGITPIILCFISRPAYFTRIQAKKLLSIPSAMQSNAASIEGLSHFHIACWCNSFTAVESFLRQGVDINAKILCGPNDTYADWPRALKGAEYYRSSNGAKVSLLMTPYAGYTPLHFAVQFSSIEVIDLLVEQGANVHAQNARGMSPLHMSLMNTSIKAEIILNYLISSPLMMKYEPSDNYGITLLHIACWQIDLDMVNQLLYAGSDVNAQVSANSPVWPGDSPLNVLINKFKSLRAHSELQSLRIQSDNEIMRIATRLVTQGADITLPNVDNITPLHAIADRSQRDLNLLRIILKRSTKFNAKQTNTEGLSFFHIACLANNLELVTELCAQGADLHRPTDYFAEDIGGCGPLHFAAMSDSSVVPFLIEKGAKVSAEDSHGCTPLHVYCKYGVDLQGQNRTVLSLCEHGADINALDIYGRTPLEILIQIPYAKNRVIGLLNCGARLNSVNPVSGESIICRALSTRTNYNFADILKSASDADILAVMEDGSTAIHNSVRGCIKDNFISPQYYAAIIEELLDRGCSLNAQDGIGLTALHVAVKNDNYLGVRSLLTIGINANIEDDGGNVALNMYSDNQMIYLTLMMYLHKLMLLGLEVSEQNLQLYATTNTFPPNEANYIRKGLLEEISALDKFQLHGSFSLRNLLTERAVSEFAMMPRARRNAIVERLSASEIYEKFPNMMSTIRYQYRRILERAELVEPAKHVLGIIVSNTLPNYCLDKIITFFDNQELKTLTSMRKTVTTRAIDDEFVSCKKVKLDTD